MKSDFNYHGPVAVFDLDDTLFRERDFCRSGFRWIERRLIADYGSGMIGISRRLDSMLRRRESYFDFLEEELKKRGAGADYVKALVNDYRAHAPERLQWAKGMKKLFDELQRRGIVMALITDGRSVTQRCKIEALHLKDYIPEENIYISEERGVDKSKPGSFRDIVRAYPEASRFIYVADNERKDFHIANLLGWTTCKVAPHHDNVHPPYISDDPWEAPTVRLELPEQMLDIL